MGDDGKAESSSQNGRKSSGSSASQRFKDLQASSKEWNRKVERTVQRARRAGRRRGSSAA